MGHIAVRLRLCKTYDALQRIGRKRSRRNKWRGIRTKEEEKQVKEKKEITKQLFFEKIMQHKYFLNKCGK